MQYLAIPWRIKCECSEHDTIKSVYDKWHGRESNLQGNVKACVGDTYEQVEKQMFEIVRLYINSFPDVQDGRIKVENFKLIYNVNAIENGQVWVSDSVNRWHQFQKITTPYTLIYSATADELFGHNTAINTDGAKVKYTCAVAYNDDHSCYRWADKIEVGKLENFNNIISYKIRGNVRSYF